LVLQIELPTGLKKAFQCFSELFVVAGLTLARQ